MCGIAVTGELVILVYTDWNSCQGCYLGGNVFVINFAHDVSLDG